MNNYKPYAYLYKHETEPATLKSCFITQIPDDKKLTIRTGDPSTAGSKTLIRYDIEDAIGTKKRFEQFVNEFSWDGKSHDVEIIVGSGSGDGGGQTWISSDDAEID